MIYNNLYSLGFKSPATPIMEGIIDLHNYIFIYLILVFVMVLWMFLYILYNFYIIPSYYYDLVKCGQIYSSIIKHIIIHRGMTYEVSKSLILNRLEVSFNGLLDEDNEKHVIKHKMEVDKVFNYVNKFFGNSLLVQANSRQDEILVSRKIVENTFLEVIWTVLPSLILILIAIPSFSLLYAMDEIIDPKLTIKAIGYQWFWTYEYAHAFEFIEFEYLKDSLNYYNRFYHDLLVYDSIMLTEDELELGYHRLLEVDKLLVLPIKTHIRILITGADVIHSWAVPSFGIKVDAVPGRMSQAGLYIKYEGTFYGQCSELCGVNHGFMPIVVKGIDYEKFINWYRLIEFKWH